MLFRDKPLRQLTLWLFLCMAVLTTAGHSSAAADLTVTVEFDKDEVRVGELVSGLMTVINTSGSETAVTATIGVEVGPTNRSIFSFPPHCLIASGSVVQKFGMDIVNLPYLESCIYGINLRPSDPEMIEVILDPSSSVLHDLSIDFVSDTVEVLALIPEIVALAETEGSMAGGYTITITGRNFIAGGTEVHFGGVAATDVTVLSSSQLTATVPAHALGAADVVVSTAASKGSSAPVSFTYVPHGAGLTLTATPSNISLGDTVTLRAAVSGYTPTGTVEFRDVAGSVMATGTLDGTGVAQVTVSDLAEGQHVLTAHYLGDPNNYPATSSPVTISVAGPTAAVTTINSLLEARANLLLANMPGAQRRLARLNGGVPAPFNPGSMLMTYLPQIPQGGAVAASASLAQMDAMAGNETQARFDAWIEGTFGLLANNGAEGRFGIAALGADYLVSEDVLIGGFFQIDTITQHNAATLAEADGTGWLAGPYLTARLSEELYLDVMAGAGRAENRVSPFGTYEDWFGSSRFIASATLQGEWGEGAWRLTPAISGSWFSETSDAHIDSMGVAIPQVSARQGQVTLGPGVRHIQVVGNGISLTSSARLDAVVAARGSSLTPWQTAVHGRVSGGFDLAFDGGASLGVSVNHDGLFHPDMGSTSIRLSLGAGLN